MQHYGHCADPPETEFNGSASFIPLRKNNEKRCGKIMKKGVEYLRIILYDREGRLRDRMGA